MLPTSNYYSDDEDDDESSNKKLDSSAVMSRSALSSSSSIGPLGLVSQTESPSQTPPPPPPPVAVPVVTSSDMAPPSTMVGSGTTAQMPVRTILDRNELMASQRKQAVSNYNSFGGVKGPIQQHHQQPPVDTSSNEVNNNNFQYRSNRAPNNNGMNFSNRNNYYNNNSSHRGPEAEQQRSANSHHQTRSAQHNNNYNQQQQQQSNEGTHNQYNRPEYTGKYSSPKSTSNTTTTTTTTTTTSPPQPANITNNNNNNTRINRKVNYLSSNTQQAEKPQRFFNPAAETLHTAANITTNPAATRSLSSTPSNISNTSNSSVSASPPLEALQKSFHLGGGGGEHQSSSNQNSFSYMTTNNANSSNNTATTTTTAMNTSSSSSSMASTHTLTGHHNSLAENISSFNNRPYNTNNNNNNNRNYTPNNNNNNSRMYPNNNNRNNYRNQQQQQPVLGISADQVQPLNKPVIPINKLIKPDTRQHTQARQKNTNANQNMQNLNTLALTGPMSSLLMSNNNKTLLITSSAQISAETQATTSTNPNTVDLLNKEVKEKITKIINDFLLESSDYCTENSLDSTPLSILSKFLAKLNSLKLSNDQTSELIYLVIVNTLSKSDMDRLNASKLFIELNTLSIFNTNNNKNDLFMNGFKLILHNLSHLECEYNLVKSNISLFAARAVCDQIIGFSDLAQLMKNGQYYPLFFLCMQNMDKLKGEENKEWLRSQLEKSRVNLIEMLPLNDDRSKERLVQVLEDRELLFVQPMLKLESALFEKIFVEGVEEAELKKWLDSHVSGSGVRGSSAFVHSLVTCVVRSAAEKSVLSELSCLHSKMDKLHVSEQKRLIAKYREVLAESLRGNRARQIEAIYAMQVYAGSKGFPKYFLAHLFNAMYDLELIEEEAFYLWKDEINESYPNKGQALFHLQRWFNWLQEASEESTSSESESNLSSSSSSINKASAQTNESSTLNGLADQLANNNISPPSNNTSLLSTTLTLDN